MPSLITASVLLCLVSTVSGISLHSHDALREPKTVNSDDRNVNKRMKRSSISSSFEQESTGTELQNRGHPVFRAAIKRHDKVFLDSDINTLTFSQVMQEIYNKRQDKWQLQKEVILAEMKCQTGNISNAKTVDELYRSIIQLYTSESYCVYTRTNAILRNLREDDSSFIGSYALMLNVIISQWTGLEQCESMTYRGMENVPQEDYTNMMNQVFAWPGFTSSSKRLNVSCGFAGKDVNSTIFIIDNSGISYWKPKDIHQYSEHPYELECLYPASVMFKVTEESSEDCSGKTLKAFHIRLQHDQSPNDGSPNQGCTSGGCVSQGGRQSATPLVILVAVLVTAHAQSVFLV